MNVYPDQDVAWREQVVKRLLATADKKPSKATSLEWKFVQVPPRRKLTREEFSNLLGLELSSPVLDEIVKGQPDW